MYARRFLILVLTCACGSIAAAQPFDEALFSGIEWRLVGPFRGGRAGTVAGVRGNDKLYYMGTAGGGVWRTTDAGATWECISDGFFGGSIGAVAVADSDPNVIYVGEGEQTVRGNVSSGWGMWRSTDAGKTWTHIGLRESEHVGRIRVHPENPDIVYVAAMGSLWGPERRCGACIAPTTAVRAGTAFSTRAIRQARSTSRSIRTTHASCTRARGR